MNMNNSEIDVDITALFDQAEAMDDDSRDAVTMVLVEDFLDFYEKQNIPAPYLLQEVYDSISNETRIIREDTSEDFSIVEGFERKATISEDIVRGELQINEVLSIGSLEEVDPSELRLPWAGKNLRKRIAAACREEICGIERVFSLDEEKLRVVLTPIVIATIAGSTISGALLAPIAVLVTLFIIQVGLNVYCNEYDLSDV